MITLTFDDLVINKSGRTEWAYAQETVTDPTTSGKTTTWFRSYRFNDHTFYAYNHTGQDVEVYVHATPGGQTDEHFEVKSATVSAGTKGIITTDELFGNLQLRVLAKGANASGDVDLFRESWFS